LQYSCNLGSNQELVTNIIVIPLRICNNKTHFNL